MGTLVSGTSTWADLSEVLISVCGDNGAIVCTQNLSAIHLFKLRLGFTVFINFFTAYHIEDGSFRADPSAVAQSEEKFCACQAAFFDPLRRMAAQIELMGNENTVVGSGSDWHVVLPLFAVAVNQMEQERCQLKTN
ncbi:hypothetical protein [Ferrimonas balearica]|uniref:hypothetical protein n=1 Tax=Ferrimonas balearica TaxID=44012 RepID=UPI001F3437E4|nr:hypothetical protein [Ferrimonas balearica]MBY6093951.1 hypothetical protein [Ferrimonas balearica]